MDEEGSEELRKRDESEERDGRGWLERRLVAMGGSGNVKEGREEGSRVICPVFYMPK